MTINQLYKFNNDSMSTDVVDDKTGKVTSFKEINVISVSEETARIKARKPILSDEWKLVKVRELNKDWN